MAEATLPADALVLRDFANTVDEFAPAEALPNADDLTAWLRHYHLLDDRSKATAAHLERALDLRAGLRDAMANHHDGVQGALPELDRVARELPLRVAFDGEVPALQPVDDGVTGALARILIAVAGARADGSWERLKLCRAADCEEAFYDASKNRSRHWCSMGVCGNRQKTRAYRARQRATTQA